MGNNNAHTEPPPPPVNPIMNSLYNTNAYMLPPPPRGQPAMSTVERVPLKLDAYIDKSKLKLLQVSPTAYRVEIFFTCSTMSQMNIHFFSTEVKEGESSRMLTDTTKYPQPICNTFNPGVNQCFGNAIIDLANYGPHEIFAKTMFSVTIEIYPVYNDCRPSTLHRTYCSFTRDKQHIALKVVKQAVISLGKLSILMDIFGMEGETEENICIICLCERKNTMILPCRHMCLCNYCADHLTHQRNKICPICRVNVMEFVKMNIQ